MKDGTFGRLTAETLRARRKEGKGELSRAVERLERFELEPTFFLLDALNHLT
jgi:hypothetical protein